MSNSLFRLARTWLSITLVAIIALTLSACGDAPTATPPAALTPTSAATIAPGPGSGSGTQEVQVTLKEWAVIPAAITVSPGHVRFVITNAGTLSHNFTILDSSGTLGATHTFAPNESPQTLELDLKPGTYDTLCSVPGHAQHGQRGTLTVK